MLLAMLFQHVACYATPAAALHVIAVRLMIFDCALSSTVYSQTLSCSHPPEFLAGV